MTAKAAAQSQCNVAISPPYFQSPLTPLLHKEGKSKIPKAALVLSMLLITPFVFCGENKIIDIHAHIGTFRGYDLSKETLLQNLKASGIQLALVSNIDGADIPLTENLNETEANTATANAIREFPHLLRGLIWARVKDGSPANIEPFLKERIFVGVKFHPEFNHYAADDKRVDGYMSLCKKYGVPAVFHCGKKGSYSDPARIYAVAKRFPNVPVILYHMGFFGPHESAIATAKEALQKKDADLYLETAQADPDAVLKAITILGADRVLFGTDASYYGRNHYQHYSKLIHLLKEKLSSDVFARVMYGNAERIFRLGRPETGGP